MVAAEPGSRGAGEPGIGKGSLPTAQLRVALCALALALLLGAPAPAQEGAKRWVSLSPSVTEIIFDIGAGPEVAGVCLPADYPPEAKDRKAVASWEKVDVEAIVALRPSACFTVEGMQSAEALLSLRRLGIGVQVYPMRDLDDLWACFLKVGEAVGREGEARAKVGALKERIARAAAGTRGAPARGAVVVGLSPLVAAGRASFLNAVLSRCGIRNVLARHGEAYPALSLEQLAAAGPEVLILPEGEFPRSEGERFLRSLQDVQGTKVRAVWVPADLLVRPGPRTADAVEIVARAMRAGASR
jgi:ABC-type Fe3+-hydroxamate transport system substrate-binding protein